MKYFQWMEMMTKKRKVMMMAKVEVKIVQMKVVLV